MILCRKIIGQFHGKLLLSSKIAKIEAVAVEPVKRQTSEFIWFKLTSNRDFNGEIFFTLSTALSHDPFRSMANNCLFPVTCMHIFCFKQSFLGFKIFSIQLEHQEKLRESEPLRCQEFLGGFFEDGGWLSQGDLDERFWGERILGGSNGFQVEPRGGSRSSPTECWTV